MNETLDAVGKTYDSMQRVKGAIAPFALIGVGVIFYLDPQGQATDLPYREELGAGLVVLGGLIAIVVFSRGSFVARLRSVMLILLAAGVIGAIGWRVGPQVRDAHELAKRGEVVGATVVNRPAIRPSNLGNYPTMVRYPSVSATGMTSVTVPMKSPVREGATLPVRVVPSRPGVAMPVEAGETFWAILTWRAGSKSLFVVVAVALFALVSIPFNLRSLIHAPPSERSDRR